MAGSETVYGGVEGPDAMYVKLISSDGHEFIIKKDLALTSGTIKAMLSGPGSYSENETNEVNFREIPSHVLQKVCQYFAYKVRYTNSATEIPEFIIAPERNGQVIAYRSVTAMAIDTWDTSKLADKKKERQKRIFNTFFTTNESKYEDQCKRMTITNQNVGMEDRKINNETVQENDDECVSRPKSRGLLAIKNL
uniref:Elongin-C n=2 Tax=Bilateria TaxID=33213 RepID=A0A1I8ET29_WUCBA